MLWKLSTDYWEALANGKSDAKARNIFGRNGYASNEGEKAGKNKRAKLARTFEYKGNDIEMMKHLKYGVKNSPSETIRIHFEWDSEDKKIVIGYCGPHLPHKIEQANTACTRTAGFAPSYWLFRGFGFCPFRGRVSSLPAAGNASRWAAAPYES